MKTKLLLAIVLISNGLLQAQNYFTEHLINQPLSQPIQIKSADIDGDGDKDFAVVSTEGELTWHEQISNSVWVTHYIAMDVNGYSLSIADLDDDSILDIVVTHSVANNGQVSWFRNDGNQNFTQNMLSNTNIAYNSNKTIVTDIDNDNDNDVISSIAGYIVILRNDGNETFSNETTTIALGNAALGEYSNDIEVLDFDNDGLLDFVVTTRYDDGINWYKQNSDNTFTKNTVNLGNWVNIAVGDMNNDNHYDIIATLDTNSTGGGREIAIFYNTGDNTTFNIVFVLSQYTEVSYVNVADIDGNGYLDVLYFGRASGLPSNLNKLAIRTILNPAVSAITNTIVQDSELFNGSGYSEYILDDVNLDNKIDIVQVSQSLGRINYFQNNDITLPVNNFTLHEVSNSASQAEGVSIADFNNDNTLDVVVSSQWDHTLEWYNNSGDNLNFSRSEIDALPRQNFLENEVADIDGDGFMDILSVNYNITAGGSSWYKNNGDNTFTRQSLQTNTTPVDITHADFDNDGDEDILTISDFDIYLFTNDGNENFTSSLLHTNGATTLYTAKTVDVNDNNLQDIVLLGNNRTLGALINLGNNTFSSFVAFQNLDGSDYQLPASFGNLYDFEFADIDNDGDLDLFGIGDHLFFLRNNGSNQVEEENILVSQSQFGGGRDLQVTDIDNDNDLDIIVGGDFGVYWAKNENLTFTRELITADNTTNRNAFGVALADMDNDGDNDVIYTSLTGNKVAWLENMIDQVLSTEDITDTNFNINIYPNPTSSILTINTNNSIDIENLKLYNIQGRLIKTYQNTNTIDVSALQSGLYLLNIRSNIGSITKQIIKQ